MADGYYGDMTNDERLEIAPEVSRDDGEGPEDSDELAWREQEQQRVIRKADEMLDHIDQGA